ncbi:MAG: type II secretion system major pseudopilin GspG [Candidatus Pacebacteria bacterium]|nr:type II secretion system major pseudopilin GspG [Candidatus Paceibacterota bacterium]
MSHIVPRMIRRVRCPRRTTFCVSKRCRSRFTLIEIMIVVVIIAALAAMVVPRLTGRSEQARIAVATADIEGNIATALKLYELDNGTFPTTDQGLQALLEEPTSEPAPLDWRGPYLEKKPVDPWGHRYEYRYPGTNNPNGYDLFSVGRDGVEGTDDDIGNWDD